MLLEKMVKRFVSGIIVGASLYTAGCGTTLHIQKGEVWYDCNTSEDYPHGHPCDGKVKAYNARMAAASPPASSSPDYSSRRSGQERGDSYRGNQNGDWVCPK